MYLKTRNQMKKRTKMQMQLPGIWKNLNRWRRAMVASKTNLNDKNVLKKKPKSANKNSILHLMKIWNSARPRFSHAPNF